MMINIQRREIIFILVVCAMIFGGLWFYSGRTLLSTVYSYDGSIIAITDEHEAERGAVQKKDPRRALRQNFETSLNDFLQKVYVKMRDYRGARKILDDLVAPHNLQNAAYIEENYALSREMIGVLKGQMDDILQVFAAKEREVHALLKGQPENVQGNVLRSWNDLKANQLNAFVSYFSLEAQVLDAYADVMAFYYSERAGIRYLARRNELAFATPQGQAQERALLDAVQALKTQQSALLKGN